MPWSPKCWFAASRMATLNAAGFKPHKRVHYASSFSLISPFVFFFVFFARLWRA